MPNPFKTSLILSLAGIFFLLLLSNFSEPKLISIGEINDLLINKKVKVQGEVFNIKSYKNSNFQILSIKDETGKIDITLNRILNLTKNQEIIVIGKVSEYEQNLQVQADRIIKK